MGLIKAGIVLGGIYLIAKSFREERQCGKSKRNYHEDPSDNTDPRNLNTQGNPPNYQQQPAPSQYKQPQMSENGYRQEKQVYNGTPNVEPVKSEQKMIGDNQYTPPREVSAYDDATSNRFPQDSNGWPVRGEWQEKAVKN